MFTWTCSNSFISEIVTVFLKGICTLSSRNSLVEFVHILWRHFVAFVCFGLRQGFLRLFVHTQKNKSRQVKVRKPKFTLLYRWLVSWDSKIKCLLSINETTNFPCTFFHLRNTVPNILVRCKNCTTKISWVLINFDYFNEVYTGYSISRWKNNAISAFLVLKRWSKVCEHTHSVRLDDFS